MSLKFPEIKQCRKFTAPAEIHKTTNSLIRKLNGTKFYEKINLNELSEIIRAF